MSDKGRDRLLSVLIYGAAILLGYSYAQVVNHMARGAPDLLLDEVEAVACDVGEGGPLSVDPERTLYPVVCDHSVRDTGWVLTKRR